MKRTRERERERQREDTRETTGETARPVPMMAMEKLRMCGRARMRAIARRRVGARDVEEGRVRAWEDAQGIGASGGARGDARGGACAANERRMWDFMWDEF